MIKGGLGLLCLAANAESLGIGAPYQGVCGVRVDQDGDGFGGGSGGIDRGKDLVETARTVEA
jgi:hypothetical protein